MAKLWAKRLYNSKQWEQCRDSYIKQAGGLCEICLSKNQITVGEEVHHKVFLTQQNINDPNITLNSNNLQLLCKRCHNEIHERWGSENESTTDDTCFDEYGNLIEKKSVHIVWGAPASGKTTYVKEHKGFYDIVFDQDYIMSALSLSDTRDRSKDTLPFVLDIKDLFIEQIRQRKYKFKGAWIITTMPNKAEREQLARELRAELIHIDTDRETCMERAMADTARQDKQLQINIINKYFERLSL